MTSILLDHFYKIDTLLVDGNNITSTVTFDIDHPIFKGHFPDMPIVPGVCQTQMLSEVLNQALKTDLHIKSAASIKFLSIVDPTKTPSLDLIITFTKNDDSTYAVSAQYKLGETVFFKFKGVFAA